MNDSSFCCGWRVGTARKKQKQPATVLQQCCWGVLGYKGCGVIIARGTHLDAGSSAKALSSRACARCLSRSDVCRSRHSASCTQAVVQQLARTNATESMLSM